MNLNLPAQRQNRKTLRLFHRGKMRLVLDDTLCVYHRCRSRGGKRKVVTPPPSRRYDSRSRTGRQKFIDNAPRSSAAATAVGLSPWYRHTDAHAYSEAKTPQVFALRLFGGRAITGLRKSKAFSLGFHKGLFLFAKRNSPLCPAAGREASAMPPRRSAECLCAI